ncbi:MAG: hypothetical protein KA224_01830 [Steroidobacteraceae bacterium]|nr:hypothetical protein [Steroidobacteraceae bacterium]MCC7198224.1 hypothetical protein [Gammaproteobacteria bacterium]
MQMLLTEPLGLRAPEILRRLRPVISQPTLWRILSELRSEGRVTSDGRGRATRYHASERVDVSTLRSRRLHQGVARRLVTDPSLREVARERLQKLRQANPQGRIYHDRWEALLDGPLPRLLQTMTEVSEHADVLRQESPFSVLVTVGERRRVFKQIPLSVSATECPSSSAKPVISTPSMAITRRA